MIFIVLEDRAKMAVTKLRRSRRIAEKERMSIKDSSTNNSVQNLELGEYHLVEP